MTPFQVHRLCRYLPTTACDLPFVLIERRARKPHIRKRGRGGLRIRARKEERKHTGGRASIHGRSRIARRALRVLASSSDSRAGIHNRPIDITAHLLVVAAAGLVAVLDHGRAVGPGAGAAQPRGAVALLVDTRAGQADVVVGGGLGLAEGGAVVGRQRVGRRPGRVGRREVARHQRLVHVVLAVARVQDPLVHAGRGRGRRQERRRPAHRRAVVAGSRRHRPVEDAVRRLEARVRVPRRRHHRRVRLARDPRHVAAHQVRVGVDRERAVGRTAAVLAGTSFLGE